MKTKILLMGIALIMTFFASGLVSAQESSLIRLDYDLETKYIYDLLRAGRSILSTADYGIQPISFRQSSVYDSRIELATVPSSNLTAAYLYNIRPVLFRQPISQPVITPVPILPVPNTWGDVVKTAIQDLAKRLRVPELEIRVLNSTYPTTMYEGIYKVSLLRSALRPLTTTQSLGTAAINPQPYGTYGYYIKVNSKDLVALGAPLYQITKVLYNDGSYDSYVYSGSAILPGNKIARINQYDKNGNLKAVISFSGPNNSIMDRIQSITHNKSDGTYTDSYQYDATGRLVSVVRTKPAGPMLPAFVQICTFIFDGSAGLERLNKCDFGNGLVVVYNNNMPLLIMQYSGTEVLPVKYEIAKFQYITDNYGNVLKTTVVFANGFGGYAYEGLVDAVDVVLMYKKGYAELIRKAEAKIAEHKANVGKIESSDQERADNAAIFGNLLNEYNTLFSQLSKDSPFKPLEFALPTLYVPVKEAIEKSTAEIDILAKAIKEGDLAAIKAHLGINIEEVPQALQGLQLFINLYKSYSGQLTTEMAAIKEYIKNYQIKEKVIKTAVQDLAARLRVSADDIIADPNIVIVADNGIYVVTLSRQLYTINEGSVVGSSSVNPQPYGTYTYYIKATGRSASDGSTEFVIDQVKYFDGSYDKYNYVPVESFWGTVLQISHIQQFNKEGIRTATININVGSIRIRTVTYWKEDGISVKYIDEYEYHQLMPSPSPDGTNMPAVSTIIVSRYANELRTPETRPICVFYYSGPAGLERLTKSVFDKGITILYNNDLPDRVVKSTLKDGYVAEEILLMTFSYYRDTYGNIIATYVKYADGTEKKFEGLVDAVDVVVAYIEGNNEIIKKVVEYFKQVVNPDSFTVEHSTNSDGSIVSTFTLPDGSQIVVTFNTTIGEPVMDRRLKDAILGTRQNIASRMGVYIGVDISEVHINGVQGFAIIDIWPGVVSGYEVTARVGRHTLVVDYKTYGGWMSYDDNGLTMKPDSIWYSTVTLTSFVDNNTGRDYVAEAKDKVLDLFNPEHKNANVGYWYMIDGALRLNIAINREYQIDVEVNLSTGEVKLDQDMVNAVMKAREEASHKLGIPIKDSHISYIMPVWFLLNSLGSEPVLTAYSIGISTPQFDIHFDIGIGSYSPSLRSLVNRETGVDLLQKSIEYLKDVVNPDAFDLTDWKLLKVIAVPIDGVGGIEKQLLILSFKLRDGSQINIEVDVATGEPAIPESLKNAILETRRNASDSMGVDISAVRVNGIQEIISVDSIRYGEAYISKVYQVAARVYNYSLKLNYTEYREVWPGFEYDPGPSIWNIITLESLVDYNTGRDYVAEAKEKILALLNPESDYTEVSSWYMANGMLTLNISLNKVNPHVFYVGSIIAVDVDLATGELRIDPKLEKTAIRVREETSRRLGIPMENVHVNAMAVGFSERVRTIDGEYLLWSIRISVSTPQFDLGYHYNPDEGTMRLTTLINRETGVYLLQKSIEYLKETVNPDSFNLDSWQINPIGDGTILFNFKLQDGSIIGISVNPATGEPTMDGSLKDAILGTRQNIASRMGVDISEVHINGVQGFAIIDIWPGVVSGYEVTARVGSHSLVVDYKTYGGWMSYDDNGLTMKPDSIWYSTVITLTSFVDNNTGRDYVAEAKNKILDIFNPEGKNVGLGYWSMISGVLNLNISLNSGKYLYGANCPVWIGSVIPVEVNLSTGEVMIDKRLVEVATKARQEASDRLNVAMGDVHVNNIYEYWGDVIIDFPSPQPLLPSYTTSVSTEKFILTFHSKNPDSPRLTSLVSKENGIDLYANAVKFIKDTYNPSSFKLDNWGINTDNTIGFSFSLAGIGEVKVNVDIHTGVPSLPQTDRLADAIIKARTDAAKNLNINIGGVYVDSVLYYMNQVVSIGNEDQVSLGGYVIFLTTPQFNLTYDCSNDTGAIKLTSLIDKNTSIDLYATAIQSANEKFSGHTFELTGWKLTEDNRISFLFNMKNVIGGAYQNKDTLNIVIDRSTGITRFAMYTAEWHVGAFTYINTGWTKYDENGIKRENYWDHSKIRDGSNNKLLLVSNSTVFDSTGKHMISEEYTEYNYNESDNLIGRKTYTSRYLYHDNGVVGNVSREQRSYDANDRLISLSEHNSVYDQNGNETWNTSSSKTYEYDASGKLIKETNNDEIINNGQIWWKCESEVKYDGADNIVEGYNLESYYYGGVATQMNGTVAITKDGTLKIYDVKYDLDENGNVRGTHVYDQDGNVVLSGDGFIHPSHIIMNMSIDWADVVIPELPMELQQPETTVEIDQELLARQQVEATLVQQAADSRFVNEMAKPPEAIQQPQ